MGRSWTPLDWKNRMMKDGYWGDDVFLQLKTTFWRLIWSLFLPSRKLLFTKVWASLSSHPSRNHLTDLSICFTILSQILQVPTTRVFTPNQPRMFSRHIWKRIRELLTSRDLQFCRSQAVRAGWSYLMVLSCLISAVSRWWWSIASQTRGKIRNLLFF